MKTIEILEDGDVVSIGEQVKVVCRISGPDGEKPRLFKGDGKVSDIVIYAGDAIGEQKRRFYFIYPCPEVKVLGNEKDSSFRTEKFSENK